MVFGIILLLSNNHDWLQWCSFEGKHSILCIRGFNYQALIRNLLVFQWFFTKKLSNLCILQALCSYIWEISPFSLQKWLWATLLRVFCKILLISPQKSYVSCQMCFYFLLCLCSIKSLHKIKFYAFCMFA